MGVNETQKKSFITPGQDACLHLLRLWSFIRICMVRTNPGKSYSGNTKGGSITVLLTSCLTGLNRSVLQIKTKIVSCHTADSKPVKQEVNGKVILPPLVFPILLKGKAQRG
jgi:hypothetical protein